jgi:hypothetical protein
MEAGGLASIRFASLEAGGLASRLGFDLLADSLEAGGWRLGFDSIRFAGGLASRLGFDSLRWRLEAGGLASICFAGGLRLGFEAWL